MRKNIEKVEVSRPSSNVIKLTVYTKNKAEAIMPIMFTADRHWDNPKSDRKLQIRHLERAREEGALVVDVGDFFCAMQGKGDRRANKGDLRPEHDKPNYLNALSQTSAEFFEPYADLFAVISQGNHETSVIKHKEYDLTERLVHDLNRAGGNVQKGKYSGYIQVQFQSRHTSFSYLVYYNHGSGGGGPVTKGVIQTNRRAAFVADADLCVSGHIHESWLVEVMRERVDVRAATCFIEPQYHLQLPTYKEEYTHEGFHIEKGRPPKPLGAWMVYFCSVGLTKSSSRIEIKRLN